MSADEREARKQRSLLRTEGTGWDVGAAVRFLASDESRWMTGTSSLGCHMTFTDIFHRRHTPS